MLAASTPETALSLAAAHQGRIDLLITDVVMPGMSGRELAERLSSTDPGLRVLFMSGYTADIMTHHGVLQDNVQFIGKPFSRDALAKKIQDLMGQP